MYIERYFKKDSNFIQCLLCPNNCEILPEKAGLCGVRINRNGKLFLTTYGKISGASFDPVEKKPLYHFYPNKDIFSIGSSGCNLKCSFCQNSEISQNANTDFLTSVTSAQLLELSRKNNNNIGIAFTYNEPFIGYEFVYDTAKLFIENNLKTVIVSNGMINAEPLNDLLPYLSAANIDLKGDTEFYRNNCKAGSFETVLKTIETLYKNNKIVEVTHLIITGLNDNFESIRKITDAVCSISRDIPLHFSRYFPRYKCSAPPTEMAVLKKAYEYASSKMKFVYVGNISSTDFSNTVCDICGKIVIKRNVYTAEHNLIENCCYYCGSRIYGEFA